MIFKHRACRMCGATGVECRVLTRLTTAPVEVFVCEKCDRVPSRLEKK